MASGSATVDIRLENVSLRQLQEELSKLCFAGFGESMVGFRCGGSGTTQSPWVTVRVFKPEAGEPAPKAKAAR